jgi:D-alanyl-D-alanine carboxypeptidase
MRLWVLPLIQSFALATAISSAPAAEAAPQANKPKPAQKAKSKAKNIPPDINWPHAELTAHLIPQLDGGYKFVMDGEAVNPDTKLPPASITKAVAVAVILDAIQEGRLSKDALIPILPESLSLPDSKFATRALPQGIKTMPVSEALAQAWTKSSNVMLYNLAIYLSGSIRQFVEAMNKKAQLEWGLKDTHFITPHGLPVGDRKQEFTTAHDLLIMSSKMIPYFPSLKNLTHYQFQFWHDKEEKKVPPAKQMLLDLGAVFKTGTMNGCDSLLALLPQTDGVVRASIQLCAKKGTRFNNAAQVFTSYTSNESLHVTLNPVLKQEPE